MRLNLIVASLFLVLLLPAATLAQQPQPEGPPVPPDPQPIIVGPDTFIGQPVTLDGCVYSSIGQIIADNFIVSGTPVSVDEAIAWIIYHPGNVPPALNPTVRFYADSSDLPGALLSEQTSVPTARIDTGVDDGVWDLDVYELTMSLVSPVTLDPGTYWVEITDESGAATGNRFCWEFGQLDATNGIAGSALATDNPPQNWFATGPDQAIQLTGNVVPVELESFEIEK